SARPDAQAQARRPPPTGRGRPRARGAAASRLHCREVELWPGELERTLGAYRANKLSDLFRREALLPPLQYGHPSRRADSHQPPFRGELRVSGTQVEADLSETGSCERALEIVLVKVEHWVVVAAGVDFALP